MNKLFINFSLFSILLSFSMIQTNHAQGTLLSVTGDGCDDYYLRYHDSSTGEIIVGIPMTIDGDQVDDNNVGIATDPTTGIVYALLELNDLADSCNGDRVLVTLDPNTGVATYIGCPGDNGSGEYPINLAFNNAGELFITNYEHAFYQIDKTTGALVSAICDDLTGSNGDGATLAYNPTNDKFYFWHENLMYQLDGTNCDKTSINLDGPHERSEGATWNSSKGTFMLYGYPDGFYSVTDAGVYTLLSDMTCYPRDYTYANTALNASALKSKLLDSRSGSLIGVEGYDCDGNGHLIFYDKLTGQERAKIQTFFPNGEPVDDEYNGLAVDPTTGVVYAFLQADDEDGGSDDCNDERGLFTLDVNTGKLTFLGCPGDNGSGEYPVSLAFNNAGELFITNYEHAFYQIDKTTGALVSAICDDLTGSSADGSTLAYNPTNDKFYHFEDNDMIELTGVGCGFTPITDQLDSDPQSVTWSPDLNAFLYINDDREVFSVTTTGVITELYQDNSCAPRGWAIYSIPFVPTLGQWGIIILLVLMLITSLTALRQHSIKAVMGAS
jgi:hypothetical protein